MTLASLLLAAGVVLDGVAAWRWRRLLFPPTPDPFRRAVSPRYLGRQLSKAWLLLEFGSEHERTGWWRVLQHQPAHGAAAARRKPHTEIVVVDR